MCESGSKEQVVDLIQEGGVFQKNNDDRVYARGGSMMPVHIPDIPPSFVLRLKPFVAAFPPGTFPEFERALKDPGDPEMKEVLKDLRRAKQMV